MYLDRLAAQNEERLCTLLQEPCELVDQYALNLIRLLDLDAHAHRVDTGLDQDTLILVAGDGQRCKQNLGGGLGFDLWDIVTFGGLGGKVGERERSCQAASDALEVRTEGLRLREVDAISRRSSRFLGWKHSPWLLFLEP